MNKQIDWLKWLESKESELIKNGYVKYQQHHKGSDFQYWKSLFIDGVKAYQIGVLIYNWTKYPSWSDENQPYSISHECMLLNIEHNLYMNYSIDFEISTFEKMSEDFYQSMKKYINEPQSN